MASHGAVLRLDTAQSDILMIPLGQKMLVRDALNTALSVLVSVGSSLGVPLQSKIDVSRNVYAKLVEVTHSKFSS